MTDEEFEVAQVVGEDLSVAAVVERVRSGDPVLSELAAQGLLPVPAEALIPLQVELARGSEAQLALEAQQSLRSLDLRIAQAYLEQAAGPQELSFFAQEIGNGRLIETILRRRDVPRELLEEIAGTLSAELQEVLLLRQDAVVERPQILDALADNPELSAFSRRRIAEYREHLLPRERKASEPEAETEEVEEASDEEACEAIAAAQEEAVSPSEVSLEDAGGLPEFEIRMLPVQVRLRLARGASRALRQTMIRDPNPQVALQVLRGNALSDQEVEQIAHSRVVVEEVMEEIVRRRSWIRKYPILRAAVANPRTPVGIAVRMVPRLSVRDLKNLSKDRNASGPVRETALRLYRIKRL